MAVGIVHQVRGWTVEHVRMVGLSSIVNTVLGIPLGTLHNGKTGWVSMDATDVVQNGGTMKTFQLIRNEDVSGVSGTGVVAEGTVFHDGQVVMSWFGRHHTLEVAPCVDDVVAIHGHGGKTVIVWLN